MTLRNDEGSTALLREILQQFDCTSGTIHRSEEGVLTLVAHEGIPDPVLAKIETVPIGKGMAGLAAERREPVQVCNLQTDDSGVAEPGARETMLEGAIAAPVFGPDDTLEGVVGIAKPEPYEFTPAERDRLLRAGRRIAQRL